MCTHMFCWCKPCPLYTCAPAWLPSSPIQPPLTFQAGLKLPWSKGNCKGISLSSESQGPLGTL